MSDQWQLHFHYTVPAKEGTQSVEMYSLQKGPKHVILGVSLEDKNLAQQIADALNQKVEYPTAGYFAETTKKIFYGPWRMNDLTGESTLEITRRDKRELDRLLFRENAERLMAEHALKVLKADFEALQRAYEIQEQALLRAQASRTGNFYEDCLADKPDLFQQSPAEMQELFERNQRNVVIRSQNG